MYNTFTILNEYWKIKYQFKIRILVTYDDIIIYGCWINNNFQKRTISFISWNKISASFKNIILETLSVQLRVTSQFELITPYWWIKPKTVEEMYSNNHSPLTHDPSRGWDETSLNLRVLFK